MAPPPTAPPAASRSYGIVTDEQRGPPGVAWCSAQPGTNYRHEALGLGSAGQRGGLVPDLRSQPGMGRVAVEPAMPAHAEGESRQR